MSVVLKVENLHKEYPGVVAVNDVSFEVEQGEVLALLGENGAGKSTMSKMISGVDKPDKGKIFVDGEEVNFNSPMDAMRAGISMVHQELSMIGEMTIAENIFLNRQPIDRLGNIRWNELIVETGRLLKSFHLDLDPRTLVKHLPVGTQQLLEILRATTMQSKLIILDEPTSSLAEEQIQLMFENIRRLKKENYSFIYITHKLDEVFQISDKVVVMRDGCYVGSDNSHNLTANQIITMMVGREIKQLFGDEIRERSISENYKFEVKNLTAGLLYHDVSFEVKQGEIVGVAGLIGAGRTEMALGILGAHPHSGTVKLDGKTLCIKQPSDAIRNGIAYISEDRKKCGLYLDFPISTNLIVMQLRRFSHGGLINSDQADQFAQKQVGVFNIVTPTIKKLTGHLSGGNQQKCLLSMWMCLDPRVLLIDEPTRGVDVGAKAEIYQMLKEHADEGNMVVVISSDLPELLGICDRIVVMHDGTVAGEVEKANFSEDRIMQLASGLN